MAWLSITQFAKRVGRTVQGIHYLINKADPRLRFERIGYTYAVDEACVANFDLKKAQNGSRPASRKDKAAKSGLVSQAKKQKKHSRKH